MTGTRSGPATPEQIARYGHIASAIRAFLKVKGWNPPDLSEALGWGRHSTATYHWLNSKGAPGPDLRPALAKLIGVPDVQVAARSGQPRLALEAPDKLARPSVKLEAASVKPRPGEALAFTVQADGQARIRLDVTLPLALATPLLRMIMDAGVVFAAPAPTSEAAE